MLYFYLVMILVAPNGEVQSKQVGAFDSMENCFAGRDQMLVAARQYNGYFELGMQAVCIPQKAI